MRAGDVALQQMHDCLFLQREAPSGTALGSPGCICRQRLQECVRLEGRVDGGVSGLRKGHPRL